MSDVAPETARISRPPVSQPDAPLASPSASINWDWDECAAEPVPAYPEINQPATTAIARLQPSGGAVTGLCYNDSTGTGWSMPGTVYGIPCTGGDVLRISVWGRPGDSAPPHTWSHRIRFYSGQYDNTAFDDEFISDTFVNGVSASHTSWEHVIKDVPVPAGATRCKYASQTGAGPHVDQLTIGLKPLDEGTLMGYGGPGHANNPSRYESDPVNTAIGNYVTDATDLALPGRGLPFAFTRTYNSLAGPATPTGPTSANLVRFPELGDVLAADYLADAQALGGLASYYPLHALSGGVAADVQGDNDLTASGTPTTNSSGPLDDGASLLFSGTAELHDLTPTGLPTGATARTVEFWYRGTSTAKQTVVSYGTGATRKTFGITVNLGGGNRIGVVSWGDDGSVAVPGLLDGTWHHVAAVYDGASTMTFYVDGWLRGSKTFASALNTTVSASGLKVSGDHQAAQNRVNGSLAEVAIYSAALSAQALAFRAGEPAHSASRQLDATNAPHYAADGLSGNNSGANAAWAVSSWQAGDWWQVAWSEPQDLNRIELCDREAGGAYFGSHGRITFSDASTINWSGLPTDCDLDGSATGRVTFPRKTNITWFRVISDSGGSGNAGLAEVEAYDDAVVTEPLGRGWTHNYSARLDTGNPDEGIRFHAEDGAQIVFLPDGEGGWVAPMGTFSALVELPGGYALTRTDGMRYEFDDDGFLIELADRNDNALSFAYSGGALTTITDTVGRTVTLAYEDGRLTSLSGPPSRSVAYAYDADGQLASVTDSLGGVWEYTYDADGRLLTITDPNDHVMVTNEYGADGRISAQTSATGDTGTFAWDPLTEVSTYTDAYGGVWVDDYASNVLQSSTDPLDNTTTYSHDLQYNLTAITDPRGRTTTLEYDTRGNLISRTAPAPLSYEESWTYTALNDIETFTDGRGNTTEYTYDADGNLTAVTAPDETEVSYDRDPAGTGLLVSTTDALGETTTYAYDDDANLESVTSPLGHETTMTYDAAGRMLTSVDARGNAPGADPADFTTTFTYDAADRLLTTTDPLGNEVAQSYDGVGNRVSLTDALDNATTYAYDAANRLLSVTDPDTNVTGYAYDDVGNLISRTDANDHVTTYEYDLANRLLTTTDPLDNSWTVSYDDAGNVATRTDANAHVITYTHDALNRLTALTYADPATPDVIYAYDAVGSLTTLTDGAGTETYAYDERNRLTEVERGSDTFTYAYDDAGQLTQRSYPGGVSVAYAYDDEGRLSTATVGTAVTTYAYDPAGNLLSVATPDGLTAKHTYDEAGRLLEVAHVTASATLSRSTYGHDAAGRRTNLTTTLGATGFSYDDRGQLTEACYGRCPGEDPVPVLSCLACVGSPLSRPTPSTTPHVDDDFVRYTYDGVGNRLTEQTHLGSTTYAYDDADRLTSLDPPDGPAQTYTYDANGNQTAAGADMFAWDAADRLESATVGGSSHNYTYAGDGRRLTAASGGATTGFVWDVAFGLPMLVAERDGAGATLRSYTYGLDLLSQSAAGATTYYHHDGLGSVSDLTSAAAASLAWAEYGPFGEDRYHGAATGAPVNPFAFTGEYHDPTGLYHLRARQYSPGLGRLLSQDPVVPMLDDPYVASYVYVRNGPLTFTDPTGRVPEEEDFWDHLSNIDQFLKNAPWTAAGVAASHLTGSDRCDFKDRLIIECYGNDVLGYESAITIGNSVTTQLSDRDYALTPGLREHENEHTRQWASPGFPQSYLAETIRSLVTTGDPFCGNVYERAAGPTKNYAYCGWDQ